MNAKFRADYFNVDLSRGNRSSVLIVSAELRVIPHQHVYFYSFKDTFFFVSGLSTWMDVDRW